MLIKTYAPVWILWVIFFLIAEFSALYLRRKYPDRNNDGGTLSELVWWLIRGRQWPHRLAFALLLVFFIDLGFHFFVGTSLFL